jgi:hypothetical protein
LNFCVAAILILWLERIDFIDNGADFVEAFSFNMIAGDQVNFDYVPGKGTRISVNNAEVVSIKKPEFFTLVLKTWTGERPPSAQFRQGILGESDAVTIVATQERFALLKPSAARMAETLSQIYKKPTISAAAESAAPVVVAKA